jgi:hypothetical protein
VATTDKAEEYLLVVDQALDGSFVLKLTLDSHLFVDLSAEAGHEGLEDHTDHYESIENSIHDLVSSCFVRLSQNPRLVLLNVEIAVRAHLHGSAKTILHFSRLHKFDIFGKLSEETINETHISSLLLSLRIGRNSFLVWACKELKDSVTKVSEVSKKLVIVLRNKIIPQEHSVLVLRSVDEQIVSPDLRRNTSLHSIITKDANVSGL